MANQSDMDEDAVRLAELSALVQLGLGKRLEDATFNALAEIQLSLQKYQEMLAFEFESGKIAEKEYVDRLSSVLRDAMKRSQKLLGFDRFRSIFGDAGDQPERLLDVDILPDHEQHGRSAS
jgi:hypothetical protein